MGVFVVLSPPPVVSGHVPTYHVDVYVLGPRRNFTSTRGWFSHGQYHFHRVNGTLSFPRLGTRARDSLRNSGYHNNTRTCSTVVRWNFPGKILAYVNIIFCTPSHATWYQTVMSGLQGACVWVCSSDFEPSPPHPPVSHPPPRYLSALPCTIKIGSAPSQLVDLHLFLFPIHVLSLFSMKAGKCR